MFIVGIVAVVWVCYVSFKGPVMSFESANAPGPLAAPAPAPLAAPAPARPQPVASPVAAPTHSEDVFPTLIPTAAPRVVTPATNDQNGTPPPDG